jgi:allantoinase
MRRIAGTGLRLALHAERFTAAQPAGAERPIQAELDAIGFAVDCARETGCPLHIVHVSNTACIDLINAQQLDGLDISCETCPHYVIFREQPTDTLAKCAPPIRSIEEQEALWACVMDDRIDVIGSDHSPCPPEMKEHPYDQAWGGISGVQHALPLLWTRGLIEPRQISQLMAGRAADLFGLSSKGRLKAGYDADFALFEPGAEATITAESLLYRHPHSPYTGRRTTGRVAHTLVRGHTVYKDGKSADVPIGKNIRPTRQINE